jgi:ubiquitin-conjugating enzyme E2 variant
VPGRCSRNNLHALREPYSNLHTLVLVPVDAALSAVGSPTSAHAFVGAFAACIMLSQQ